MIAARSGAIFSSADVPLTALIRSGMWSIRRPPIAGMRAARIGRMFCSSSLPLKYLMAPGMFSMIN